MDEDAPTSVEDEAVEFAGQLIRIDTSNTAAEDTLKPERPAAQWVAEKLGEVGYETTYVESGAPGRGNVVARLAGSDPDRGALLVHGHLDVVPADATEWSVHPFSGAIQDGYLWGRGAVDMKDMDAMMLAVARWFKRDGLVPPRDIIFAFVADEEAGGTYGAKWLVEHRPELFADATEAIGEVGGFSVTLPGGARAYLIETAEKGIRWLSLHATGTAGHGSMVQHDNAVAKLAAAVTRLGSHRFPEVHRGSVREFLAGVTALTGIEFPEGDVEGTLGKLGGISRMIGATLRDTANVTMFNAGYKANVVPSQASASVDCRVLPGREEAFEAELDEILGPEVARDWLSLPPVETTFDGALVDAMAHAVLAEDPEARTLPYMLSGGTDAKHFGRLGIRCFGFAPLRLPADLDFSALFHGVDERVPVDALQFGTRALQRFLREC
jgi:acetylornithine deacetylase/succinyl-diaminopimelate desuccinylase-like protein